MNSDRKQSPRCFATRSNSRSRSPPKEQPVMRPCPLELCCPTSSRPSMIRDFRSSTSWCGSNNSSSRHVRLSAAPRAGALRLGRERSRTYFIPDRKQSSVFEVDRPHASVLHPTTKPVALMAQMIANSSRPGEIVYDPILRQWLDHRGGSATEARRLRLRARSGLSGGRARTIGFARTET